MNYNLITILGPTAVGKTALAARLAQKFNGEIISADSRQVYKGMDIGTGKDLGDYIVEGIKVPYHVIDIVSPHDEFDLYKFYQHFRIAFKKISSQNKPPFLVGGTGLFLHSILANYNLSPVDFNSLRAKELNQLKTEDLINLLKLTKSKLHNTTDLTQRERIIKAILIAENSSEKEKADEEINSLTIGVKLEREMIKKKITIRLKERLQNGMIEEAEKLIAQGIPHDKLQFFGLEYKYLSLYLLGELNYNDMYQKLNSAINNFAKRQMTWFRKMEKRGIVIHWIDGADFNEAEKIISEKYFNEF